jgi:hypothetical protein
MATLAVTGSPAVMGPLPNDASLEPGIVYLHAWADQDGNWVAIISAPESQIPALTALGCTVVTVTSDADQVAAWVAVGGQVDDQLPIG